jgi:hypothetical protein
MINHARMYAQQEYDRIMELVTVLQKQADDIRRRLDITDLVHAAVYQFSPVMGNTYWLAWDRRRQHTLLTPHGPNDWSSSVRPKTTSTKHRSGTWATTLGWK